MKPTLSSFRYHLPPGLIAQEPLEKRDASRLLYVPPDGDGFLDHTFRELPALLKPGDYLVLNDTKVFKARLAGRKAATGGKVEIFLLKMLDNGEWKAMVRPGKSAREGTEFILGDRLSCTVQRRLEHGRAVIAFHSSGDAEKELESLATVPLPPYIKRKPEELDDYRYQTVYASRTGAVAAPTAGLHFTPELLARLERAGIGHGFVTLHVGPGTFQPLRFEELSENTLEPEEYHISGEMLEILRKVRREGGRIVAVGTTTTRILETVNLESGEPLSGETNLFIYPPYEFRNVDALITNFHLPGSSLLCLVAAFMGYERMMKAYDHAIEKRYRFYSYGDAMLIERNSAV